MKAKVTKKEIRSRFRTIYIVSDPNLFSGVQAFAYSTRSEGWACDYYLVNGVCFCYGYAPIKGVDVNKKLESEYESKMMQNDLNNKITYNMRKSIHLRLLNNFAKKVAEQA